MFVYKYVCVKRKIKRFSEIFLQDLTRFDKTSYMILSSFHSHIFDEAELKVCPEKLTCICVHNVFDIFKF